MAATAVSEVSLAPPSMLICVNKSASLCAPLLSGAQFCINVLHCSHEQISTLCGGKAHGEARFETGEWLETESGVPFLSGAQASLFCETDHSFAYGTHAIVIGRIYRAVSGDNIDPLIYVAGRYSRVQPA